MKTLLVPSFDSKSKKRMFIAVADEAALYCAIVLVALFMLALVRQIGSTNNADNEFTDSEDHVCDEIYVVEEGETLQTISNKCSDSYIVERNPHIHDPDDVFPGLLIKIIPNSNSLV